MAPSELPIDAVKKRLAELEDKHTRTGLYPRDPNVPRPPTIPEHIAKRKNTKIDKLNPSVPKGKDKNSYFNVLREVGNYVHAHNEDHKENLHMQYRWYGKDVSDKDRVETLMNIIGDIAPRILGEKYGKMTYDQLHRELPFHLQLLVLEVAYDESFDPLTQGVRFFPARKLVGAKLFSKRKAAKAAEARVRQRMASNSSIVAAPELATPSHGMMNFDIEPAVSVVPDIPTPSNEKDALGIRGSRTATTSRHQTRSVQFSDSLVAIPTANDGTMDSEDGIELDAHQLYTDSEDRSRFGQLERDTTRENRLKSAGSSGARPTSTPQQVNHRHENVTPVRNAGDPISSRTRMTNIASRVRINPLARKKQKGNRYIAYAGQHKNRGINKERGRNSKTDGTEKTPNHERRGIRRNGEQSNVPVSDNVRNISNQSLQRSSVGLTHHLSHDHSAAGPSDRKNLMAEFEAWLKVRDQIAEPQENDHSKRLKTRPTKKQRLDPHYSQTFGHSDDDEGEE